MTSTRSRLPLLLAIGIACVVSAPTAEAAGTVTAAAPSAVVGIHDGSANDCDNNEHWVADGAGGKTTAPVNGPAAQAAMADTTSVHGTPWWQGLTTGTARFSVPWDIALPDSPNTADQNLVTANDPSSPTADQS